MSNLKKKYLIHKGVVGFVLLAFGLLYAVYANNHVLEDTLHRGEVTRGIICNVLSDSDKQAYTEIPAESKILHISEAQLLPFLEKSLQQTAADRAKLGPSIPAGACYSHITQPVKVDGIKQVK